MEGTRTLPENVNLWSEQWATEEETAQAFRVEMCREGAPHHLAKYNRGVYEFAVDVFDAPELIEGLPGAPSEHRRACQAAEQQLAFMMNALDDRLSGAETGRLIRMVVHAEQGALFAMAVTPHNYVLGIVFGAAVAPRGERPRSLPKIPLVRDADVFVAELATNLRDEMGMPSQNPGGWHTRPLAIEEPIEEQGTDELVPGRAHLSAVHRWGPENVLAERLAGMLNPTELIYLARNRGDRVVEEADLFGHSRVAAGRPPGEPPEVARSFYRRLSEDYGMHARQLGQIACQAVRGRILRIVLDVEQGAIYYYRLRQNEYLVGVTMNQKRVSQADERLGDLVAELFSDGFCAA